jgi:hypothetical protein
MFDVEAAPLTSQLAAAAFCSKQANSGYTEGAFITDELAT